MNLRKIINAFLCLILIFLSSACSKKNKNITSESSFVGIAFFQNSTENAKWNNIKQDPSLINNIIETNDDKITYSDDPAFLFYVYTNESINKNTKDESFISNTTKDLIIIENSTITFNLERIAENTEVLIYFIYKIDEKYYLKFVKHQDNISEGSETIILDIDHEDLEKVKLVLNVNLSTKEEY